MISVRLLTDAASPREAAMLRATYYYAYAIARMGTD